MSIIITTDEGRSFPLGSDHVFAKANQHAAMVDYIRGDRDLEGLVIPDAAFTFEVRHVSPAQIRKMKARARPRSSGRGLTAVAAIRGAGRDAYKEARRKLAPMGLQAGALAAQNRAMAEALDALSEADYAAHKTQEEHEIAIAIAVAGAAIEQITVGAEGQTVRELVIAQNPGLAKLFDGDAYPIEWVVDHVIMPTWTDRYRKTITEAAELQTAATLARDEAGRALREAMLKDVPEPEQAAVLARYVIIWEACRDVQAITQLASAAGNDCDVDAVIAEKVALLFPDPESEDETEAPQPDHSPLVDTLARRFVDLGEAEFAGFWLGESDPARVLLEIGRHIIAGTGRPKA